LRREFALEHNKLGVLPWIKFASERPAKYFPVTRDNRANVRRDSTGSDATCEAVSATIARWAPGAAVCAIVDLLSLWHQHFIAVATAGCGSGDRNQHREAVLLEQAVDVPEPCFVQPRELAVDRRALIVSHHLHGVLPLSVV